MKCEECRYWSEMLAQTKGDQIAAMCLLEESPFFWRYTLDDNGCKYGALGFLGAIDAPGNDGIYETC